MRTLNLDWQACSTSRLGTYCHTIAFPRYAAWNLSSTFTVYPLWLPRLAEIIPDHSTIGAYSNSLQARLYKQTGQSVPNILMLAAFGGPEMASTVRHFMSLLEMAERELSKEHFAVQDSVHPKDKGPFLYWLANERNLDLHGRFHTRACLLYEWEGHTCLAPF